ncbi:MAG: excinuclease ABC subunit UvrC [Oligoflexales bacterium]|nr:excinuclease ABC subunit UvrC [Oligoflexales bacterium]
MTTNQIYEKLKHLPDESGVYLFKDLNQKIIYVGKAKSLKKRVPSYFRSEATLLPRTRALVSEIRDMSVMIVETEADALLLERTLIKHHKPPFNVLLRDDKEYPFIKIDIQNEWPRIRKVRKRKSDGALYLGPFPYVSQLNLMLDTVMNSFPLVRCSVYEFERAKRPCNYYHMKKCLGPCTLKVDSNEYKKTVLAAAEVIKGNNKDVVEDLKSRMREAAAELNFELAAQLRDQVAALSDFHSRQSVVFTKVKDADSIGFFQDGQQLSLHVLIVRDYCLVGHDHFDLSLPLQTKEEALIAFLMQYYENREVPKVIFVPFSIANKGSLILALDKKDIDIRKAKETEEKELHFMACRNARFLYEEYHRKKQKNLIVLESTKKLLSLKKIPYWIECIDISHIQGTATVGSVVAFKNGSPEKSLYRMYNLHDQAEKPDDYACIHEVVKKRLERAQKEEEFPDLIIIDGGKGQLHAALDAKKEHPDIAIEFVGLAKSRAQKSSLEGDGSLQHSSERVFKPGSKQAIALERGSSVFRFMTQLRDEAHRFAITQHRRRRSSLRQSSALEQVKGIGPALRKRLFETFADMEGIQNASLEQLVGVKGLTAKIAKDLYELLHKKES